ncbi:MAG: DMT family transporter [Desulfovibrionales bacterium]
MDSRGVLNIPLSFENPMGKYLNNSLARAGLALVASMLLWSTAFVGMKIAVTGMHPVLAMAGRMLVAVLAILPLAARFRRGAAVYAPGDWVLLGLMVLCEPCLFFLFESYALTFTSGSQASMVVALLPIMILVGARLTLNEPISGRTALGIVFGVAGTIWLTTAGPVLQENVPNPLLGNFLEFLAILCAVGSTLAVKKLTIRYSPHFLTACQAAGGLVFFLPLALFLAGPEELERVRSEAVFAVTYLGLAITLGAYGLWNYAVSRLPAGRASAATNLIPVFSVFFCFLFLEEGFTFQQFLASGVVLAGVFLTTAGRWGRG